MYRRGEDLDSDRELRASRKLSLANPDRTVTSGLPTILLNVEPVQQTPAATTP